MNQHASILKAKVKVGHSACPHDCPSTCALDVELLGDNRIGRVHGAAFGLDPHFRISYATADSALEAACDRIEQANKSLS